MNRIADILGILFGTLPKEVAQYCKDEELDILFLFKMRNEHPFQNYL